MTPRHPLTPAPALAAWVLGVVVAIVLLGCTVTPKRVNARAASWDGTNQHSGLTATITDSRGSAALMIVTPHWRDRYNALIEKWGTNLTVHVYPDEGVSDTGTNMFLIDAQHYATFLLLNSWEKGNAR